MPDNFPSCDQSDQPWLFTFDALDEQASLALAADLAPLLIRGDVLALDGDLGMGKSTFARALLRARAEDPLLEVPSPTFTLVQSYTMSGEQNELEIHHFDLYRISDFEELYEIGFEDATETGCVLVEWPERAEELLPEDCLWLHFTPGTEDTHRCLVLSGSRNWGERLERLCQKRRLLIASGWGDGVRKPIAGDLSPRQYDRVLRPEETEGLRIPDTGNAPSPCRAILMDMPERKPGPRLEDGRLYDLVAHRVTSLAPMLSICEGLKKLGLHVPDRYGVAPDEGLMLWEDFGTETLAKGPEEPFAERYLATTEALARLHLLPCPSVFEGSGGLHRLASYDKAAFLVELDVFLDHYWPHIKGVSCPSSKREAFSSLWHPLLEVLCNSEQGLVLRDVQDPNCFWLETEAGVPDVGFIDFQDCLIGPVAYDLSALAMDARVTIPPEQERAMLARYRAIRGFDEEQTTRFMIAYRLCGAQRILKNIGAFARAAHQANRPVYLEHMPRSLSYLRRLLEAPPLSGLADWLKREDLI
ncbi:tRNA (adenosine(37)-N6)-threonylcarbamoyltransferase complex ATPase subunit type 1 TsaE [uncultured Cohaesibacter sp.]|uniref:tRNA (adenosine(37)-N6)-threonylcarbamoyltransferase complex ATPase subunit type 1 TsaE n=1 Tax=uncultured Cohaesibacter sp. TaxID=1002546 RepID=UPI00292FD88F|nr:tRNA (adenosine(37)-N6)-threonylcarbamoyltransferase complex ATPase subunit type 1 TsaE [uncultured Cohaesibacter sp.]